MMFGIWFLDMRGRQWTDITCHGTRLSRFLFVFYVWNLMRGDSCVQAYFSSIHVGNLSHVGFTCLVLNMGNYIELGSLRFISLLTYSTKVTPTYILVQEVVVVVVWMRGTLLCNIFSHSKIPCTPSHKFQVISLDEYVERHYNSHLGCTMCMKDERSLDERCGLRHYWQ